MIATRATFTGPHTITVGTESADCVCGWSSEIAFGATTDQAQLESWKNAHLEWAAQNGHDTPGWVEEPAGRMFTDHRTTSGAWCRWSRVSVPVDYPDDTRCPVDCPSSGTRATPGRDASISGE